MSRWNCGRCGYLALSSSYEDFVRDDGVEGTETHKCPVCGEQWWLDEDTYARMRRTA
jgi:ribosomal protein S27AE